MNQQVGLDLLGRAERQLHVSAVHGIASLKGDYFPPAHAGKLGTHFCRSQSQITKIIMRRNLCPFQSSSDIPGIRLVDGVIRTRMGGAGAGENCPRLGLAVGLPDFFHVQHGQHHAFGIAQRDFARAHGEFLGKLLGYVQRNWHRPKRSVGQAHVMADAFVIGARHETPQRRESAREQQLKVAKLAAGQVPRGPLFRMRFHFRNSFWLSDELNKFPAVWRNEMASCGCQVLGLLDFVRSIVYYVYCL